VSEQDGHVVLAGFVAPVDKWIAFEQEWALLLKSPMYAKYLEKRGGLVYAHGRKMRQWPDDVREAFYAATNYLLRHTIAVAIASVFKHSDYHAVFHDFPLTNKDSAFGLAFRAAMVAACKHSHERRGGEPVAFFLESGDKGQGGALKIFEETKLREKEQYPVESLTIVPKEKWGAVQVADMHAYSLQKHMNSSLRINTGKGATHPYFGDIGLLLSDLDHAHVLLSRELIRDQRKALIHNEQVKKAYGKAKYAARQAKAKK
jgi:hypothetical protein